MANDTDDAAFYTAGIPRLYDEYVAARANAFRPNNAEALKKLELIIDSCAKAKVAIMSEKKA